MDHSIFAREDGTTLRDQAQAADAIAADRTRDLADTVKELESFTYSVAHDLRAPLRAIHGFSRALLEDYGDRFDGEPLDFMRRICTASERMSQLIDDLLKLSKIGRGEVEHRPVDLSGMALAVGDRLAAAEPGRDVRLEVQGGITVHGEERLLLIVLENLIGNAWKFTRGRPRSHISMSMTQDEARQTIHIADNGTGFDMRYRHKLFAPFQRLHRNEEFEGTGIGLVTVARIIGRHNGEVWIEGAQDAGATASFFLPKVH